MPRQTRYIVPDVAVHIVQRGNDRAACFRDDSDYLVYMAHLRDRSSRLGCALHAYCLMTNHVHLLLTPASPGACIALMRDLGQRYVQYFNRRHGRSGTLWEGRYRSCVTESARYVLACYRYIELNPVRAGMTRDPLEYPWSSHAANIGARPDSAIRPHAEFEALSPDMAKRCSVYRAIFDDALATSLIKEIRDATNGGYPLGSDALKSRAFGDGIRLAPGKPGPRAKEAGRVNSGSDPELFG